MTLRLYLVLVNMTLALIFFWWGFFTKDLQKKQVRLLYSALFTLAEIVQILGAIAIHIGAYPLWNNR